MSKYSVILIDDEQLAMQWLEKAIEELKKLTGDKMESFRSELSELLLKIKSSLLDDNFARIHWMAFVNINHIEEIIKMFKGNYKVIMKDEIWSELPVSRSLKHKLGLYIFNGRTCFLFYSDPCTLSM